jgi:hypothetical protein
MIEIHLNPGSVEKILFVSGSETEEDFDFAAWQAIRPMVEKIDQRLRRIVATISTENRAGRRAE